MSETPQLPTEISPDGREVWAWAAAFSAHTHRVHKIRELRADLFRRPRECGACDKWMKSKECPREHNVNGQSRGPSMGAPICGQFVMSASDARIQEQRQAELAKLETAQ